MYLTYSQRPVLCPAARSRMRTRAQRLYQLKVFLAQNFGGVANRLLFRIDINLVGTECVLLRLPLRQMLLLFLARPVHGGIGAVV
ncbi:serine/threonine-protein kinase YPK2/YKR2 [Alternaria alternata]|nr:serine/threonine-protein kinase YPK2/YKR2 [Alternaria alternata]